MNDPYVEETVSSISRLDTDVHIENHKYSNHNGGNFIIGKHEHKILPIFSRKYTLDQGTSKEITTQQSPIINHGITTDKRWQETEVTLTPLPRRGILKNQHSEPIIDDIVTESPLAERRSQSTEHFNSKIKYRIHFPNLKPRPHSSQEFVNPAFEPDETVPKDFKLRDLVEHALRQQNDEFLHPYGRSNLYTSVFLGQKSNAQTDTSKLAFWGILLLVLLGITGGIIFMAEMHRHENSRDVTTNTTTQR